MTIITNTDSNFLFLILCHGESGGTRELAAAKIYVHSPKTNFKYFSAFADKDENPHLPGSDWDLTFTEQNGITKVSITIKNDSLDRMEKMIEMGFKEGFTMTLNSLDEIFADR